MVAIADFTLSLPKLYFFVFFSAVYGFLVFWIATTLLLFWPFALFGLGMYFFVAMMHKRISSLMARTRAEASLAGNLLLVPLIFFCVAYLFGVYQLQAFFSRYFGIPAGVYEIVALGLHALSLGLGAWLSFFQKVGDSNAHPLNYVLNWIRNEKK